MDAMTRVYAELGGLYPHILLFLMFLLLIAKIGIVFALGSILRATARYIDRKGYRHDQ